MLAAPGCLLAAGLAVALGLAAFGRHPMWLHEPGNLSEAAAVRDVAEIVRLIEYGENPNVAQEFQAHGYALAGRHIREPRRRGLDPKRGPVDLVGILDGGVTDEIADGVASKVRQRVVEGPIPDRHGPRELVPLFPLESGGVIDDRGPPDMDAHRAILDIGRKALLADKPFRANPLTR